MVPDMIDDVARQAAAQPDAPAIILPDTTLTWRYFDGSVEVTARRLSAAGLTAGSVLASPLEPSIEAAILLFATGRIGATLALLPVDAPGIQIEMMLEQTRPTATIQPSALEAIRPAERYEPDPIRDDRPRLIVFTSGSEGIPRGIVLTDGNLAASVRASISVLRLLPGDRWLACMPFHHIAAPSIFLRAAAVGSAVVPLATFEAGLTMSSIRDNQITAASLVPTMLARMLDLGWVGDPDLRLVLLGGGPASVPLLNAALDRGIPVAPTYGMTEAASQVATLPPAEVRGHLGSVGRPIPETDLRIADDPERPLPPGDPGRIWLRGPTLAERGLGGPLPRTAGWFGTGDLGLLDGDGYLTVLGRVDDVIVTGGEKVVPREVEDVLVQHPAVLDAIVVGIPDREWGQRAVAAVILRPDAPRPTPQALRDFVRDRLIHHKVPRAVIVFEDLPRIGPGKIDRSAVREQILSGSMPDA